MRSWPSHQHFPSFRELLRRKQLGKRLTSMEVHLSPASWWVGKAGGVLRKAANIGSWGSGTEGRWEGHGEMGKEGFSSSGVGAGRGALPGRATGAHDAGDAGQVYCRARGGVDRWGANIVPGSWSIPDPSTPNTETNRRPSRWSCRMGMAPPFSPPFWETTQLCQQTKK